MARDDDDFNQIDYLEMEIERLTQENAQLREQLQSSDYK